MTITVKPATVTVDGFIFEARPGTIRSTMLGYEDHGIMSFMLDIQGDAWGVGAGGFGLDTYDDEKGCRAPTVYTGAMIAAILGVMKVRSWEKLIGLRCHALFEGGMCRGIANADLSDALVFKTVFEDVS